MKKAEKVEIICQVLEEFYPDPPIPLQHQDAYTLLVAVVLSAQCTDAMVNRVTPSLFALADTPWKMSQQSVDSIREIIRPCGLSPSKARNIHALSQLLCERHGGEVPQSWLALEALPGVGHKTASVVMSQAFGQPAFPVDTHIHRLAWRWGLSNGHNVEQTEKDCKRLFPEILWNKLHLQMIYFGRKYCSARQHDPLQCPLCQKVGRRSLFLKGG